MTTLRRAAGPRALTGRAPALAVAPAAVGLAFLALPLVGLAVRAPWADLGTILGEPAVRQSLVLSLWTSALATVGAVAFGVPLAWVLARGRLP